MSPSKRNLMPKVDEWQAELRKWELAQGDRDGSYQTREELEVSLSEDGKPIPRRRVLELLKDMKRAGRLESIRLPREAIDGVMRSVPAYRLKKEAKKGRKR